MENLFNGLNDASIATIGLTLCILVVLIIVVLFYKTSSKKIAELNEDLREAEERENSYRKSLDKSRTDLNNQIEVNKSLTEDLNEALKGKEYYKIEYQKATSASDDGASLREAPKKPAPRKKAWRKPKPKDSDSNI